MGLFSNKYVKWKYRVFPELDLETLDFPKESKSSYIPLEENIDLYIPCGRFKDTKISEFNKKTLTMYITNGGWKDIRKEYRDDTKKTLSKLTTFVESNSQETEVRFLAEHLDVFAKYVNARTSGAKIDPYKPSNLKILQKKVGK